MDKKQIQARIDRIQQDAAVLNKEGYDTMAIFDATRNLNRQIAEELCNR